MQTDMQTDKEADMAELLIDGDELVVSLTGLERAESLHGDIRISTSAVTSVEVVDDAIHTVHGFRAPGTGIPGRVAVGTYRSRGSKLFAVVHHDATRGVHVRLTGADFSELVIGTDAAEEVVARVRAATTSTG